MRNVYTARMSSGNIQALLLSENCHHEMRVCPVCNREFLLSSYLADQALAQLQFVKRLRQDHERDPENAQPHAGSFHL